MLRGVNKRIIEINDTGSEFFERALFFVKTSVNENPTVLQKEADRVINEYFKNDTQPRQGYLRYTENKRKIKRKKKTILLTICAVGTLAVILLTIMAIKFIF